MLKLLGSALILGAGVWLRWNTLTQRRRMRRVLEECLAALRRMAEEIRMARNRHCRCCWSGWPGSAVRMPPFYFPAQQRRCGGGNP